MTEGRAIAWGGVVVGVLDLADALIFFGLRARRRCASARALPRGLLGRAAFTARAARRRAS